MLLSITTTHRPATDLGYLLHKNPANVHQRKQNYGMATVFYSEVSEERCTANLLVELNPIDLVRGRRGSAKTGFTLGQYVNDRPYTASSFLSVAMADCFGSTINGRCKDKPDLADRVLPLEAHLPVVLSTQGEDLIRRLFEPLGYEMEITQLPLDEQFPEWGESNYFSLMLKCEKPLKELLGHLYVLIPVMDKLKHYWVGKEEVENLLRKGETWLAEHPERELITTRYLRYQRKLAREALARLLPESAEDSEETQSAEEPIERKLNLHQQRLGTVLGVIRSLQPNSVLDLGCGEGKLLRLLLKETKIPKLHGMDVDSRSLEYAADKLRLEQLPQMQRERLTLFQGSLLYRDPRLEDFDIAALVEVIEHLDAARLQVMERVVFEFAKPGHVIVTTPNSEYNVLFETLEAGRFRHTDHRFEWTRPEFREWVDRICTDFGYEAKISQIGDIHEIHGAPSQMAVFSRKEGAES